MESLEDEPEAGQPKTRELAVGELSETSTEYFNVPAVGGSMPPITWSRGISRSLTGLPRPRTHRIESRVKRREAHERCHRSWGSLLEIPRQQYGRPAHVASARKVAAIGARDASHAG